MLLAPSVRNANYSGRRKLLPGLTILSRECFSMSPALLSMRMALPEPIIPPTDSDWIHCRMRVIEDIGGRWSQTTKRQAELRLSKVQQTLLQDILYPPQLYMTTPIPIPETLADMSTQRKFPMLCFTRRRFITQDSATLLPW